MNRRTVLAIVSCLFAAVAVHAGVSVKFIPFESDMKVDRVIDEEGQTTVILLDRLKNHFSISFFESDVLKSRYALGSVHRVSIAPATKNAVTPKGSVQLNVGVSSVAKDGPNVEGVSKATVSFFNTFDNSVISSAYFSSSPTIYSVDDVKPGRVFTITALPIKTPEAQVTKSSPVVLGAQKP